MPRALSAYRPHPRSIGAITNIILNTITISFGSSVLPRDVLFFLLAAIFMYFASAIIKKHKQINSNEGNTSTYIPSERLGTVTSW